MEETDFTTLIPVPGLENVPPPKATRDEHALIAKKAYHRVLGKVYEDIYWRQIEEGNIVDPILIELAKARNEKADNAKSTWIFVTINPSDDSKFDVFKKALEKCMKKQWITDYIYAFEQRSEEKNVYAGIHAHAYIKRNGYPVCNIKRELKSTFKHVIGNDKAIDIKFDGDKSWNNRVSYILGHKDPSKRGRCLNDTMWREKLGLDQFYATDSVVQRIATITDEK